MKMPNEQAKISKDVEFHQPTSSDGNVGKSGGSKPSSDGNAGGTKKLYDPSAPGSTQGSK